MFVSVVLDPGGIDSARSLVNVLVHSGFKKIQRACWESMNMTETELTALKKEIDRVTDYYDTVRIYQFPIDNMFVITELKQKRWKRCQLRNGTDSQEKIKHTPTAGAVRNAQRSAMSGRLSAKPSTRTTPRGTMHKQ